MSDQLIKINLAPEEELENPMWFVPDVVFAVLICVIGYFGVQFYLDGPRQELQGINEEKQQVIDDTTALGAQVQIFENKTAKLKALNDKFGGVKKYSGPSVLKYQPIIVIEHLQNLKPRGVWFEDLIIEGGNDESGGTVTISGFGFDNLIIAEFLGALRATQTQDVDDSDLRTHVFFDTINLSSTDLTPAEGAFANQNKATTPGEEEEQVVRFSINMHFKTREVAGPNLRISFQDEYPVNATFDLAKI